MHKPARAMTARPGMPDQGSRCLDRFHISHLGRMRLALTHGRQPQSLGTRHLLTGQPYSNHNGDYSQLGPACQAKVCYLTEV